MKIIKQYKQVIIFVVFLLVFILAGVFYVFPTILLIKDSREEIKTISLKNDALTQKIQTLNSFSKEILDQRYFLVNQALLQSKNPYQVFDSFDKIMSRIDSKNVVLGEIQFSSGEIKKKENLKANDNLMFETNISGNYDTVLDFIDKLENGYPLMTVKSIDGKLTGDKQVDFGLNITLFVYPEIAFIPSIATPVSGFLSSEDLFFQNLMSSSVSLSLKEEDLSPVKSIREDPFQ